MKKLKVFLCWTLNSGTSFYRMMNPGKYMKRDLSLGMSKWKPDYQGVANWEFEIKDPQISKDLHVLTKECDIVIAQKFHSVGGLALMDMFKHQYPKKPFYTDMDDNVFSINADSPAYNHYHPNSQLEDIIREQLQLSTGVIVSTDYLRTLYERFNPNIWVIPNGIDFGVWDKLKRKSRSKKRQKKIRVGWAGGGSHVEDLEFIEKAVKTVLQKHKNVEFVFLGGVPPCFKDQERIVADMSWYSVDKYPQALADLDLDIGLAPLRDNPFNRGKSNLRWLEYSALGIPSVVSDVESFKAVEHSQTGLKVTENDQWVEAISHLIEDKEARLTIGQMAQNAVRKDFNVKKIAEKYVEIVKMMCSGKINISKEALVNSLAD